MKHFIVDFNNSEVSQKELNELFEKLRSEIMHAKEAFINSGFDCDYASLNLLSDSNYIKIIHETVSVKKMLKPSIIVVIGIGGSNLGTLAVQEALFGKLYNEKDPSIKIYYADTVDSNYIQDILQLLKKELNQGHKVLINVVTK